MPEAKKPPDYAAKTTVPVNKSIMDIKALVQRYGAGDWALGEAPELRAAVIGFSYGGYRIRIYVRIPDPGNMSKTAYDQVERQRWREMYLLVKAKLVAVAGGHRTVEEEFLGDIVLPGAENQTFTQWYAPQLKHLAATNQRPPLLPGLDNLQLPSGKETP